MQIVVSNIAVEYDGTPVLTQVDFAVRENEKIALVGRNGCGKTTLLKVLTGEVDYTCGVEGEPYGVFENGNPVVGFLKQTSNDELGRTMLDEIMSAYAPLLDTERKMESARLALEKDAASKTCAYIRPFAKNLRETADMCIKKSI